MTALETYVKDKKRQEYIKKVRAKINKLGIYGFLRLKNFTNKKLVVLGGVTEEKMNMVNFLKAEGFAAINYFQKKRPL